ncbi:MAG: type II secretion system protein GspG [Deltaproteobacteria bacterium]|nr:type II secretion system protein GspG [Deltaproteobacteria bacterium]
MYVEGASDEGNDADRPLSRARPRGFSLVEIMVVIAIIGLIAGVVGVAVVNALKEGEVRTARIQIGNLNTAVKTYRTTHRSFPDTLEEVSKYLEGGKVPLDPWDQPYLYLKKSDASGFEIHSKGPDKADGTDDDVFTEERKTDKR